MAGDSDGITAEACESAVAAADALVAAAADAEADAEADAVADAVADCVPAGAMDENVAVDDDVAVALAVAITTPGLVNVAVDDAVAVAVVITTVGFAAPVPVADAVAVCVADALAPPAHFAGSFASCPGQRMPGSFELEQPPAWHEFESRHQ
jgi:hypothetical protein